MSILAVVRPDMAVTVPIGVRVSAAVLRGRFMHTARLRALLDRVSPLCGDGPLARLDASDLVDADRSLGRVLYVDVHQGRVERHCEQTEAEFTQ